MDGVVEVPTSNPTSVTFGGSDGGDLYITTSWVDSERRGTWIWYRLRPEAVARFSELAGGFSPGPARRVTGTNRRLSVVQPLA